MKKVRFETPDRTFSSTRMNDSECHSPRPVIERQVTSKPPELPQFARILPYSQDPVQRYECSNSSPYPVVSKTCKASFRVQEPKWKPSNELELSMLDPSGYDTKQSSFKPILKTADKENVAFYRSNVFNHNNQPILSSIQNKPANPPNVLTKDNDFFIRRDNLNKFNSDITPLHNKLGCLSINKENYPSTKDTDLVKHAINNTSPGSILDQQYVQPPINYNPLLNQECMCHHCIKVMKHVPHQRLPLTAKEPNQHLEQGPRQRHAHCPCIPPQIPACSKCDHSIPVQYSCRPYNCHNSESDSPIPQNGLQKKKWMVERFEQSKTECTEIEKQTNITKEKREPTVSDLFKIIKLQNEQLQLLQEKVDKFISGAHTVQPRPVQSNTEHIALENNEHKISIGVMTSFEMVRTSTIINKEVLKQTNENSQIQCNRSQISIKEVVSKSQPATLNFLDGIMPVEKRVETDLQNSDVNCQLPEIIDEKTLNELSLYNVHVDNATTPLMSPEQSLYLDVRDYSDSEAESDDQSNVGWTYYNKVMTHVNGVLQDSDMPSSASALCRNTRQQCVQMHIDKTNVSVTKRVKFGDDPLGIYQPHIYASTDTSLKMNQLAAKYLKVGPPQPSHRPVPKQSTAPIDMSYATRNYMERHKLLQGGPSRSPQPGDIPRFLDITALKQQTKLL